MLYVGMGCSSSVKGILRASSMLILLAKLIRQACLKHWAKIHFFGLHFEPGTLRKQSVVCDTFDSVDIVRVFLL